MANLLYVFLMSMLPLVELRGSVILGAGLGLPLWQNYCVSVIGSMLPVPFILLFVRRVLHWMSKVPRLSKIAIWIEERARKNSLKVMRYATFGLCLFVAIPLPGTGAWTGALIAALMDMRLKYALPSIFAGILIAGGIMSLAAYGVVAALTVLV